MYYTRYLRRALIAAVASGAMLVSVSTGFAQTVRTFDEAPTMEQLRAIMMPESHLGRTRSIVIQRPDPNALPHPVQPASTQTLAPPSVTPNRPVAQAAHPGVTASAGSPAVSSEAVAFHINFAFNSAVRPASAHRMIDRIAQLMKEEPQLKLRVEGHTDATGSANYNMSLSEQRALSVTQYLVAQGIAPDRLVLVGRGKAEPLMDDPYDSANRRVQFVRVG